MIGEQISHYRIAEKIGSGGMGEVYLAEDTRLQRKVALKFLPRSLTADPDARRRFEREAQAAAALNHPNIITIYEIGEHEGQVFIGMEYVEGQTLQELITSCRPPSVPSSGTFRAVNRLPISQVLDIATQIASGLAAAHEKGIIHRDIKPANVFITRGGSVKLLDFGLAKLAGGQGTLTKDGTTLGTVAYMSPEQGLARTVDQRTDIWSLGVVMYEMLAGRLPYRGDYEQTVIYSILNEEPEALARVRPDTPAKLQRLVSRALAKDPGKRYSQAGELAADLRSLAAVAPRQPGIRPGRLIRATVQWLGRLAGTTRR